jgi:hypothetical protein
LVGERRAGAADGGRRQVDVVLRQTGQGRAGGVHLGLVALGVGRHVDALPAAEQVVEAVVLLVDDHDVLDAGEAGSGGGLGVRGGRGERDGARRGQGRGAGQHAPGA